jgi:lipoprotein signal peptidase
MQAYGTVSLEQFSRPIVNKLRMLSTTRSAFIFYCVTWAIVGTEQTSAPIRLFPLPKVVWTGIAGSFLDNHTWIVELMTEILLLLYYVLLYRSLR